MLTNVPKEVMEYPDFSFQDHFRKAIPSYVDVCTVREYLEGAYYHFYRMTSRLGVIKTLFIWTHGLEWIKLNICDRISCDTLTETRRHYVMLHFIGRHVFQVPLLEALDKEEWLETSFSLNF